MALVEMTERDARPKRCLRSVTDGKVFAYLQGNEFIRRSDGRVWARLSDGQLFSARSGVCLAYKVGEVYYDAASREPAYFESRC
jgi:hypothetical protein